MKKRNIFLIVILIVIGLFSLILITNSTFLKGYLKAGNSKIPLPKFTYCPKESCISNGSDSQFNSYTFYTLQSVENSRNFINKYLDTLTTCYDESYFYDKEENVTINVYSIEDEFPFNIIKISYILGNYCENEFVLEDNWMREFLDNAIITEVKGDNNLSEDFEVTLNANDVKNAMNDLLSGTYTRVEDNKRISPSENYYNVRIYYSINNKSYDLSIFDYQEDYIAFSVVDANDAQKNAIYQTSDMNDFFNEIFK